MEVIYCKKYISESNVMFFGNLITCKKKTSKKVYIYIFITFILNAINLTYFK